MLKSVSLSRLVAVLLSLWILQQVNGEVSIDNLLPSDFQILNLELNTDGRVTADIFISVFLEARLNSTTTLTVMDVETFINETSNDTIPIEQRNPILSIQLTSLPRQQLIINGSALYRLDDIYTLERDKLFSASLGCPGDQPFISTQFETTSLRQSVESTTGTMVVVSTTDRSGGGSVFPNMMIVIICVLVLATLLLLCVISIVIAIAFVTHRRRTHKLVQMSVSETESADNQTVDITYEAMITTSSNVCYDVIHTSTTESSHTHTELTTQEESIHLYDDVTPAPSTSQSPEYVIATPIYDNYENVDPSNGLPIAPDPSPVQVKSSWVIPPRQDRDTLPLAGVNNCKSRQSASPSDTVSRQTQQPVDYEIPVLSGASLNQKHI